MIHTEPSDIRTLYIITNEWHMNRTKAIFNHVFSLQPAVGATSCNHPSSSSSSRVVKSPYTLRFNPVTATGLPESLLRLRKEREESSLRTFQESTRLEFQTSMMELHRWLFHKHGAYATSRLLSPSPFASGTGNKSSSHKEDVMQTY